MSIINLTFILIVFFIGINISGFFLQKKINLLESSGFGFGAGVISVFLISIASITLQFPIVISFIVLILCCIFLAMKNKLIANHAKKLKPLELLLLVFISANVMFVLVESIIRPLIAWDGIASWFFGGKALYIDGKITSEFYHYANYDFPPLFQTIITTQSNVLNGFSEQAGLLLFPFTYISIVLMFYSAVRAKTSRVVALFATFLLAATHELVRHGGYLDHGHVDILFSYFVLGCGVLFLRFRETRKTGYFLLMQVFLIGVAFTKNEGITLYGLFQILNIVYLFKDRASLKFLAIISVFSLLVVCWFSYKLYFLPPNYRFEGDVFSYSEYFLSSFSYIFREFINISRWSLLWIVIALSTPLIFRKPLYRVLFCVLLMQLAVYITVYFVSPNNPIDHIKGSFDRLLLHVFPLAFLLSMLSLKGYEKWIKVIKLKNGQIQRG